MTVESDLKLVFPSWPQHGELERTGLLRVLEQEGWWRNGGSEVDTFEADFADFHGAMHAISTTNGTHALELGLGVLGVGPGDEVIVPAFTFIASSLAVQRMGATPVPVDIDPDTLCLDMARVAQAITPKTRVIMPVHMAGQFCDMDALSALVAGTDIAVLQDAAHAHGATWQGRRVGEFGSVAAFSFQNGKLMTAGEGGALLLPDKNSYEQAYLQHSCGRPPKDRVYEHRTQGSNYRMNEFAAAVLRGQLARLPEQLAIRENRWNQLQEALAAIPSIKAQQRDSRSEVNSHYMVMFRLPQRAATQRNGIVEQLNARGVPAFVGFPPVYQTEGYWQGPTSGTRAELAERCPVSEEVGEDCLWLHHRVLLADPPVLARLAEELHAILQPLT